MTLVDTGQLTITSNTSSTNLNTRQATMIIRNIFYSRCNCMYLITVHIHEYALIFFTNLKSTDHVPRPQIFSDTGVQGFF